MSDDHLRSSLEDLFSDFLAPVPEGEAGSLISPPSPPEPGAEPPSPAGALAGSSSRGTAVPDEWEEGIGGKETAVEKDIPQPEDMRIWRQGLIRGMLRSAVIVGAIALVAGSFAMMYTWLLPLYLGAYAILVLITFWRRAPYALQAGTILGLIYCLGILGLFEDGLSGDGRVFLLTLPLLAVLFFGQREGVFALILAVLTLVAFGWAFSTGRLVIPEEAQAYSADPISWLSGTIVFLMLCTVLVISQNYLVPRLAHVLVRSRELAQELGAQRARSEERVVERTKALQEANYALRRRAMQLEASAEVGRAITSIFDVDQLLRKTVDLIRDRFGFYHAGVFLIDETGEWAVLQEATGEVGQQMKAQGHRLAVGDHSMVGWTAARHQPRIALDVGEDAVHFVNPLLPYTRSEMTQPLIMGGRLLGVLDTQSTEEAAFDEDDVRTLRIMADQIAVAIDNARKISDEALLLEATSPVYRASRRLTRATTTDEVTGAIMYSVAETGADGCVVVEFEFSPAGEPEALLYLGVWRRDREPQFRPGMRLPIAESPFPFEMVSTLWTVADVERDERLPRSARQVFEATDAKALANIPLHTRERVIGQVVVLRTTPGPFSESALRLYEMLSDQAAVALERARLLEGAQQRAARERVIREISDQMQRATDMETLMHVTAEGLNRALGASCTYARLATEAELTGGGGSGHKSQEER